MNPHLAPSQSHGNSGDDLWGLMRIAAPRVWDITRGIGVVVTLIDADIDHRHPDLAANVGTNSNPVNVFISL